MNVNTWIKKKYSYSEFEEEKIEDILYFGLVWNIFEDTYKITDIYSDDNSFENIEDTELDKIWEYFKTRYVTTTKKKEELLRINENLRTFEFGRSSKDYEYIKSNIVKNNLTKKEKIKIVLLIIKRFRNNLYHGYKKVSEIYSQNENFKYSNNFLMKIIDLKDKNE